MLVSWESGIGSSSTGGLTVGSSSSARWTAGFTRRERRRIRACPGGVSAKSNSPGSGIEELAWGFSGMTPEK
jgi:hypothetical protein